MRNVSIKINLRQVHDETWHATCPSELRPAGYPSTISDTPVNPRRRPNKVADQGGEDQKPGRSQKRAKGQHVVQIRRIFRATQRVSIGSSCNIALKLEIMLQEDAGKTLGDVLGFRQIWKDAP